MAVRLQGIAVVIGDVFANLGPGLPQAKHHVPDRVIQATPVTADMKYAQGRVQRGYFPLTKSPVVIPRYVHGDGSCGIRLKSAQSPGPKSGYAQSGVHDRTAHMDDQNHHAAHATHGIVLKSFTKVANAGDAFSARLARHVFGIEPEVVGPERQNRTNLLLVGSILQWADCNSIVCGAGLLSERVRPVAVPCRIIMIRGPHTHRTLDAVGIAAPASYADPGVLAPLLFARRDAVPGRVGLVAHYVDLDTGWVAVCRDKGIHVIDPAQALESYFDALQSCEVVLSSSLHGLVFAHAYGRPAIWIELGDRVIGNGFKFLDYYSSLGVADDEVSTIRIRPGDDPFAIAALATCPATDSLVANAEEALHSLVVALDPA